MTAAPDLYLELIKHLEWALDLLDMYDERMVQLGDPKELVYSDVHIKAKAEARALVTDARQERLMQGALKQ